MVFIGEGMNDAAPVDQMMMKSATQNPPSTNVATEGLSFMIAPMIRKFYERKEGSSHRSITNSLDVFAHTAKNGSTILGVGRAAFTNSDT